MQAIQKNITVNFKGKLRVLTRPLVMGIINATPDSFYKNSRVSIEEITDQAHNMLADGADILDIGGYSTRPGASEVSVDEELERTIPIIQEIANAFPNSFISIDTFRARVAEEAVRAGACIINDISAGEYDPEMMPTVARLKVPYIMMHKKGNPQNMNSLAQYDDVVLDVIDYLANRLQIARSHGIVDVIADPGFGFAKNTQQNYILLSNLNRLKILEIPILVGMSRKRMIQQATQTDVDTALYGTIAANTIALMQGVEILRVHDVKAAIDCINIVAYTKLSD
jgi:dihydropteroate synthase